VGQRAKEEIPLQIILLIKEKHEPTMNITHKMQNTSLQHLFMQPDGVSGIYAVDGPQLEDVD
jgi:hypothetical protein